jgi:hypothetical protein
MPNPRLSYEESCRRLQKDYLGEGAVPPLPDHLPRPDDEEPLGVSFFRTFVGERDDLSNLFLPHTFFGRSEINDAVFRNTDFTESNFCWIVWFVVALLVGMGMAMLFPPLGGQFMAGIGLDWRNLPGTVLGLLAGVQSFRASVRGPKKKDQK